MKRKCILIATTLSLTLSACQAQTAVATQKAETTVETTTAVGPHIKVENAADSQKTTDAVSELLNLRIPVPETAYFRPEEHLARLSNLYEFYVQLNGEGEFIPSLMVALDVSEDSELELEEYIALNIKILDEKGLKAEDCGNVKLGNGAEYRKITSSNGTMGQDFYIAPVEYDGEQIYYYISVAYSDTEEEVKKMDELIAGATTY